MILAIDPGNKESAYVLYENGVCHEAGKVENHKLLIEIIPMLGFDHAAIEVVRSMGMVVGQEVFDTCIWIGRFIQKIHETTEWRGGEHQNERIEAHHITRANVKMFLCNSMRAKDKNIRQALIDIFGPPPTKKDPNPNYPKRLAADEWSALAVAVTAEFEKKIK